MNYFQAIILAIAEGLTEFLPISSTGHLILTSKLLSIPESEFLKSFEVIIQTGAILAVVFLYKNILFQNKHVWTKIIAAFIPTGIIGLLLYDFIKTHLLGSEIITVCALCIGGIVLIFIENLLKNKKTTASNINEISIKNAFLVGVFQSISIIPGASRAASSIIGARILGINKETSVLFSFLLAIPTIIMASIYDLAKSGASFSLYEYSLLFIGFLGSFFVAVLSIKFFMVFIKKHTFIPFGIYRIVLAVLFWFFVLN